MNPEQQQQRIMGYFIEEAKDHLNTIEQGVLNLQDTLNDSEAVNEVFRAAHSIKGGAAMLGVGSVQHIAHRFEDYFKVLRENPRIKVDEKLKSLLLAAFDRLQELLDQLQLHFKISDDFASTTLDGVKPVFAELETHLSQLTGGAVEEEFVPAPVPKPEPVAVSDHTTLVSVFQTDVTSWLRDMLQIFKQDDQPSTRQQLQTICEDLSNVGKRFGLNRWCELIKAATSAIANTTNSYRTLAPVVIKDIKQAQDLVIARRATEINISLQLQELLLLEEPMAIAGDSIFDDREIDFTQHDIAEKSYDDNNLDLNLEEELVDEIVVGELDWLSEDEEDAKSINGPEVGASELKSLANLFDSEDIDLSSAWEDMESTDNPTVLQGSSPNLHEQDEFADLFSDSQIGGKANSSSEILEGMSEEDDMLALFGNQLGETSKAQESQDDDTSLFPDDLGLELHDSSDSSELGDGFGNELGDLEISSQDNETSDRNEFLQDENEDFDVIDNQSSTFDTELTEQGLLDGLASLETIDTEDVETFSSELEAAFLDQDPENSEDAFNFESDTPADNVASGMESFDSDAFNFESDITPADNVASGMESFDSEDAFNFESDITPADNVASGMESFDSEDAFNFESDITPADNAAYGMESFDSVESVAQNVDSFTSNVDFTEVPEAELDVDPFDFGEGFAPQSVTDTQVEAEDIDPWSTNDEEVSPVLEEVSDEREEIDPFAISNESGIEVFGGFEDFGDPFSPDSEENLSVLDSVTDQANQVEDSSSFDSSMSELLEQELDFSDNDDLRIEDAAPVQSDLQDLSELGFNFDEDLAEELPEQVLSPREPLDDLTQDIYLPQDNDQDIEIEAVDNFFGANEDDTEDDLGLAEFFGGSSEGDDNIFGDDQIISEISSEDMFDDSHAKLEEQVTESDLLPNADVQITETEESGLTDSPEVLSTSDQEYQEYSEHNDETDLEESELSDFFTNIENSEENLEFAVSSAASEAANLDSMSLEPVSEDESATGLFADISTDFEDENAFSLFTDISDASTGFENENSTSPATDVSTESADDDLELGAFFAGTSNSPEDLNQFGSDDFSWDDSTETDFESQMSDVEDIFPETTDTAIATSESSTNLQLEETALDDDIVDFFSSTEESGEMSNNIALEFDTVNALFEHDDLPDSSLDNEIAIVASDSSSFEDGEIEEDRLEAVSDHASDFDFLSESVEITDAIDTQLGSEVVFENEEDKLLELNDFFSVEIEDEAFSTTNSAVNLEAAEKVSGSEELADSFDEDISNNVSETLTFSEALGTEVIDAPDVPEDNYVDETENIFEENLSNAQSLPSSASTTIDNLVDFFGGDDSSDISEIQADFGLNDFDSDQQDDDLTETLLISPQVSQESISVDLSTEEAEANSDSFDDLEAMLSTPSGSEFQFAETSVDSPVSGSPTSDLAVDSDFDELEALLGGSSTQIAAPPQPEQTLRISKEVDEFDDLDRLLKDTYGKEVGSINTQTRQGKTPPKRPQKSTSTVMKVDVKHLDSLNNLVGELVVNRNLLEQDQERMQQFISNLLHQVQLLSDVSQRMRDQYDRSLLENSLLATRGQSPSSSFYSISQSGDEPSGDRGDVGGGGDFDALEMDRFSGFHALSQEIIELIVRVKESTSDIAFVVDETEQVTRQLGTITTQIQDDLKQSRMVPFAQIADRLPRGVRDRAIQTGKQADIEIHGRETLIDKAILEQLLDPITHLVNNAIDHGLETPSTRQASSKPAMGKITVRAYHQGNQTVISIGDDGAGIHSDKVKQSAVEKGLLSQAEARQMSEGDVYNLLFTPGFSTKKQADEFAGRGVGLDVVSTALSDIRGSIHTESMVSKGTTFTIRLPLTLSISKAMFCISDRTRIAFPVDAFEDVTELPQSQIQLNSKGQPCLPWRDTILPFQPLSNLLSYSRHISRSNIYGKQDDDVISIIILRNEGNYLALQVDQFLGESEIVIKQLEGPIPKPAGIAGATVLGDGRVMAIANVLELFDIASGKLRPMITTTPPVLPKEEETADPTVLIVDDSITVRELLSLSFSKVGYRVEQARDGQDAWEKLRAGLPCDLIFCDIEMPRMDGLDLLSRLQKDATLSKIPVAMLTSRGADRHRQTAVQLGAKGYFTKPYLEEELLSASQKMLKGEVLVSM